MELKIEIGPEFNEEVILRAPEINDRVLRIQQALKSAVSRTGEIALRLDDSEIYVPYSALHYFEVDDDRVWAHDCFNRYICPFRLNQLSDILPATFTRASKSLIINTARIKSITRFPTGLAQATFADSQKVVYISRMYYKTVRKIIEETRL